MHVVYIVFLQVYYTDSRIIDPIVEQPEDHYDGDLYNIQGPSSSSRDSILD